MKNARYMLGALAALATLAFATTALAAVVIKGTKHDDVLTGTDRNDMIVGRQGNDTINGLAGNDRLHGNQDNDAIDAGPGNDRAWGGYGNDSARRRRRERHPSRSPRRRLARRRPRQRPPLARPRHRQAAGRRRGRRPPLARPGQAGRHDRLRPRQRRPLDQRQGDVDRHLGQLRDRQERDRPRRRRRLLVPLSPQGRMRPEAVMPPAVSAFLNGRAGTSAPFAALLGTRGDHDRRALRGWRCGLDRWSRVFPVQHHTSFPDVRAGGHRPPGRFVAGRFADSPTEGRRAHGRR